MPTIKSILTAEIHPGEWNLFRRDPAHEPFLVPGAPAAPTVPRDGVAPDDDEHVMQCMEVWGGNSAVDNGVVMPGLDAWVYCRPEGDSVQGGDVYLVSSCAAGHVTRILLGDVSGHGDSVAKVGESLRHLMKRYVNYLDQSQFISRLNSAFGQLSDAGGFATAVAATYWATRRVLVACNAGHPLPLWYRARDKRWVALDAEAARREQCNDELPTNLPLGVVEPTRYEQFGVHLGEGDIVIFHTDSLIESRNAAGRHLGMQGLLGIVRSLDVSDPRQLMHDLLGAVRDHRGGVPASDDMSIIMLRQNGSRPSFSRRERAMVLAQLALARLCKLVPGSWSPSPPDDRPF